MCELNWYGSHASQAKGKTRANNFFFLWVAKENTNCELKVKVVSRLLSATEGVTLLRKIKPSFGTCIQYL